MSTNERQAALRAAGAKLANCAYNLAQLHLLPERTRQSLDEARREWDAALAAQPPAVSVDEAMVERAEAARMKFWETDSNYPETEAEFDADPEKYDRLAMRSALTAALNPEAPDA